MSYALWLERKFLQVSPEFETWARKYAQEIEQKVFRGGKLPVQSPNKELRWVPLTIGKLQPGYEASYNSKTDTIYLDPSVANTADAWYIANVITHEGVHAFDPKTKIQSLGQQYASKVSTTAKPGSQEYTQLPQEFEAIGGGNLEYAIKSVASSPRFSIQQKLKIIDDLKDWFRTGKLPQSGFAQSFARLVPKSWKNNPQLWRQFREKFYITLERIRGKITALSKQLSNVKPARTRL